MTVQPNLIALRGAIETAPKPYAISRALNRSSVGWLSDDARHDSGKLEPLCEDT
ncbi:hypothetical protein CI1B_08550 [Bradyrhizobium ivorense]|uniref:Uncharacterized protein n=1 Tax=Bradyrhizobium ivorense TaxID=2511166 RepID=A0A508SXS2_9BRAD|nr:hypothetical protein CI1B_08550 [Bradyrhizobium ivorense]